MWKRVRKAPAAAKAVISQTKSSLGTVTSAATSDRRMRVRFQATEWFALSNEPISAQPGDQVQIMGRVNATTLLVTANAL